MDTSKSRGIGVWVGGVLIGLAIIGLLAIVLNFIIVDDPFGYDLLPLIGYGPLCLFLLIIGLYLVKKGGK